MSFNNSGGGAIHKRPYDSASYQGSVGFIGVGVDMKRPKPDQSGGSGDSGGAAAYGLSGSTTGPCCTAVLPRLPGKEVCINFRRTGTCKFGSRCNYDHPSEVYSSNSGGLVSPAVNATSATQSTSGTAHLLQQGQMQQPRQPPPHPAHYKDQPQQHQQHFYGQQPQQQQHHQQPGFPSQLQQQPQSATQASLGQQRFTLKQMPVSSASAGEAASGRGYSQSSHGSVSGVGGNNSTAPTSSTPSNAQQFPGTPYRGAERTPSTTVSTVESPASAPLAQVPGSYGTAQPIRSKSLRTGGSMAQTRPGYIPAQASETQTSLPTVVSANVATSLTGGPTTAPVSASTGVSIYNHITSGYEMAPPPTAPVTSPHESVTAVAAAAPTLSEIQNYHGQQQPVSAYGGRVEQQQNVGFVGGQASSGGHNGATTGYRSGNVGTAPAETVAVPPSALSDSRSYGQPQLQQQHQQPDSSGMLSASAANSSGYKLTAEQSSAYPGASWKVTAQPATGASSAPLTIAGSVSHGVLPSSAAAPTGYGPHGIQSGSSVPLRTPSYPVHGNQSQTASSPNEHAGTGAMSSAACAYGGTTTQDSSSGYVDTPSTGVNQQQAYGAEATVSPAPTVEPFGVTGLPANKLFGVCSSSSSYGGHTTNDATREGHQSASTMSATSTASVRPHQASAASASRSTIGKPLSASVTIGSSAFASKSGSATKPLASSTAPHGGRASPNAGESLPLVSATALVDSSSKGCLTNAASAAHGVQQEAPAESSVGRGTIDSPAGGSMLLEGRVAGGMVPTVSYGMVTSQKLLPSGLPGAEQYIQMSATQPPPPTRGPIPQQPQMQQSPWQQTQLPPGQTFLQQDQQQQGASGELGSVLRSPQGGYSGYGHSNHVLTTQQPPPQQQQQQSSRQPLQSVFHPGPLSYGAQMGSQCSGGLVGPGGAGGLGIPGGAHHGSNASGSAGFSHRVSEPGQQGPPPPQNMPPGVIGGRGMIGGPGTVGAPPVSLIMPSGMMGPGGLVASGGPPGLRHCGPGGNLGVRHEGPGATGGHGVLQGQSPPRFRLDRPAPNMPQRPAMPDCHSFVKSGSCRFALACKYNHPYNRLGMPVEFDDSQGIVVAQDRAPCDVYLNAGLCTFGDKCRFRHITRGQLAKESAQGISHPDPNQLPKRAGHPPCGFYARTGKCAFGMKCKFDHPTHQNPPPSLYSSSNAAAPARAPAPSPQPKTQTKSPSEVTARHILVKHKMSRRPASWQDPTGSAIKQRTQAQAATILQGLQVSIKTQDDFSKVAMTTSDCSSAKRGGDLGSFSRGKMQRAFEDAAFGLRIGGVSSVVSTDSGMHLIMRTA